MSIDPDSDTARLARHRDANRTVHPDIVAENQRAFAAYHERVGELEERLNYTEMGLAEWRNMAQTNARHAEAARATARVAIGHLQAMLNKARNFKDQQDADTAARDWLISIGSEP